MFVCDNDINVAVTTCQQISTLTVSLTHKTVNFTEKAMQTDNTQQIMSATMEDLVLLHHSTSVHIIMRASAQQGLPYMLAIAD